MKKDNSNSILDSDFAIALLGPENSYSQEIAQKHFPNNRLILLNSISDIFENVFSDKNLFGLVPIENVLHGPVTEFFDSMTNRLMKENQSEDLPEILLSFTLEINHFIGVPDKYNSIDLSDIEEIYSHPQALSQSQDFIEKKLPKAALRTVRSTSLAPIYAIKAEKKAAAIASRNALLAASFKLISETVPEGKINQTRFVLIGRPSLKSKIFNKLSSSKEQFSTKTSICIHPGKDRKGLLLDLLKIISEDNKCNLLSIHSRPDENGGFIFYFDIEGDKDNPTILKCMNDLKEYCKSKTAGISKIFVFGSYPEEPFTASIIKKICIVGSKGNMGNWLKLFFEANNLSVLPIDIDSTENEKNLIRECDAILLSTPIRDTVDIFKSLISYITPGSLVIENCSIKSGIINVIEEVSNGRFEVLGIHTMFGPGVTDLIGQNVIITKRNNSGEKSKFFEDFLYKHGANIYYSTIEEHDKIVSILQAFCQFSSLGAGYILSSMLKDIDSPKFFMTPNANRIITSAKNVYEQSINLTVDLQNENPYSKQARECYLEFLNSMHKLIDDKEKFESKLEKDKNKILPVINNLLKSD